MKKLSDLPQEEKHKISSEIDALSSKYTDPYEGEVLQGVNIEMGLCSSCKELLFTKTQYGTFYARCEQWDKRLNGIDLVVECTGYRKRGEMTLFEMKDLAVLIDPPKRKIGIV